MPMLMETTTTPTTTTPMLTNGKRRTSDVVRSRICPTRCAATCCRAAESGTTNTAFCTKPPHDANASHIPPCVWVCARERDDTKSVAINTFAVAVAVAVGLIKGRTHLHLRACVCACVLCTNMLHMLRVCATSVT